MTPVRSPSHSFPPRETAHETDEIAHFSLSPIYFSPIWLEAPAVVAGLVLEPAYRLRPDYMHPLAPAFTCVTPLRAHRTSTVCDFYDRPAALGGCGTTNHVCPLWKPAKARTCADSLPNCGQWAKAGECTANPGFMMGSCPRACGKYDAAPLPAGPISKRIARGTSRHISRRPSDLSRHALQLTH